jgi:hypothetical protein
VLRVVEQGIGSLAISPWRSWHASASPETGQREPDVSQSSCDYWRVPFQVHDAPTFIIRCDGHIDTADYQRIRRPVDDDFDEAYSAWTQMRGSCLSYDLVPGPEHFILNCMRSHLVSRSDAIHLPRSSIQHRNHGTLCRVDCEYDARVLRTLGVARTCALRKHHTIRETHPVCAIRHKDDSRFATEAPPRICSAR